MEISLLIRLIIAHLLTDFIFQSDSWVNQKYKDGWHSKHLYLHGQLLDSLHIFSLDCGAAYGFLLLSPSRTF